MPGTLKLIDQPLEISILGTVKDLFRQYLNLRLPNNKKYKPTFVMFSCATATEGEERGAQRSVGGVSHNAMHLRYCRTYKLNRTLLRSFTLSFASNKGSYKTTNYFSTFPCRPRQKNLDNKIKFPYLRFTQNKTM